MSESGDPHDPLREAHLRGGCANALMIIGGVALLFPGLCVLLITGGQLDKREIFSPLGLLIIVLVFAGIALIIRAARRGR
jgi:hypothetical protein